MQSPRKEVCDCGLLDRAAKEPDHPVRFDPELQTFYLSYRTGARMDLYYCPFCGGRLPRTTRESRYAHITDDEQFRILKLFESVRTEQDVLSKYGTPDEEIGGGAILPEKEDKPSRGEYQRVLTYRHLSPVADVSFAIGPDGRVGGSWTPKMLGQENG